jgi:small subunit ribosomal protein S3
LGHKVHPTGFRLGVVKSWQSRWYAERDYRDLLAEDIVVRALINKELANASVSKIEIERAAANQLWVAIHTARPGIVIGKSGEKVERLKSTLEVKTKKRVRLEIKEIRQPELDAYLVARAIAEQLEKRVSFRRAMKQAVQKSMRSNAKGIKIIVGGRLGGAEIARSEKEVEGKIPLHTLRADIDYGLAEARTTFGVIGIKVWIYKGDILPTKRREASEIQQELAAQPGAFPPREPGERRGGDRRRSSEGVGRGERGSRPPGERLTRPQGERSSRPPGERPSRPQGERAPRQTGERPQGERPPRQVGERPQGERAPRQTGERPQGERPPRQTGERPQGERPPRQTGERAPRQTGERTPRAPRAQGERTPRQQDERAQSPQAEQAPDVSTAPEVTTLPPGETGAAPTESE